MERLLDIAFLSLLAGLISLDITAFGHFMISRPIVCAPLFGYLLGDIKTGLWIGMIIELVWVGAIPMGAAIPNDSTAIAILSTIWGLKAFPNMKAGLILSIVVAIPTGFLSKKLDIAVRYFNVRLSHRVERGVKAFNERTIVEGISLGMFLFFLKAFVFYFILIYPGQILITKIYGLLGAGIIRSLTLSWKILPVLGFGIVLINFRQDKFPFKK